MGYSILAVRTSDDDDGRLHPALSDGHTMVLEPLDGAPSWVHARGLIVSEMVADGLRTHLRIGNVKVDVMISDARLAVGCVNFDSGEQRSPGIRTAILVKSLGSVTPDDGAGYGRMLVGHVRYPWLRCVGFKPRTGWRSRDELRLGVVARAPDGDERELFLDVQLPRGVDSASLARSVVAKAARYHLAYSEVTDEVERDSYEHLAEGPRLAPAGPTEFALYRLPSASFVSAISAYPPPIVPAEVE